MCERMVKDCRFDVLVVGGGPAGIAAAVRASHHGVRVGLLDDNPSFGGQIWRGPSESGSKSEVAQWKGLLESATIVRINGVRVFDRPEAGVLLAEERDGVRELRYHKLILATGARERFLPFPGWTLPNVMGAGGLQAMVKSGLPIRGKRVVVAGTGPLLLAVAAHLKKQGAEILVVCEQASKGRLARFVAGLATHPGKLGQGLQLLRELGGTPISTDAWVMTARGGQQLASVKIWRRGKIEELECDYLACGFHLVPNTELAALLGCEMPGDFVKVDEFQQTSVDGVYCAGEPTGIGGVEQALVEGQIAGLAAIDETKLARQLFGQRRRAKAFAGVLERTFRLRPELRSLAIDTTFICRCEDVVFSRLKQHESWRSAKLHTRCGMGPCQGRVCGPATEFLFGWKMDSVRPPVFPARVESLASMNIQVQPERRDNTGGAA